MAHDWHNNVHLRPYARAIEAVLKAVDPDNPPALGILCNGSAPQGFAESWSDLDICVCCDAPVSRFVLRPVEGVAVDLHYEDGRWLRQAKPPYEPTALFMLAHAEVLWEKGDLLSRHVRQATEQFLQPTPPVSEWDRFLLLISCSTLLERTLKARRAGRPSDFLMASLLGKCAEASLRLNRLWYLDTARGLRDLARRRADLAERLEQAAAACTRDENTSPLVGYLNALFAEELPLSSWDSGFVKHQET
jgi:hypothetical protein